MSLKYNVIDLVSDRVVVQVHLGYAAYSLGAAAPSHPDLDLVSTAGSPHGETLRIGRLAHHQLPHQTQHLPRVQPVKHLVNTQTDTHTHKSQQRSNT